MVKDLQKKINIFRYDSDDDEVDINPKLIIKNQENFENVPIKEE